ncbi:autotransporter outer membrane beta-barrel domain-containing protein [Microvirga sp. W0021]|uniref:Autotransporter outer membrane beta-barrel domain-containing protein n=1 Tax=Hohaiivirga grylli TaxID=3133970 RepID=A0ABV0BGF1_9HYPH
MNNSKSISERNSFGRTAKMLAIAGSLALLTSASPFAISVASGQTINEWIGSTSDRWIDDANWSSGSSPDDINYITVINKPGSTVWFPGNDDQYYITIGPLYVGSSTIGASGPASGSLIISTPSGESGYDRSTILAYGDTVVGQGAGASGSLEVRDISHLGIQGGGLFIGVDGGTGTVNALANGKIVHSPYSSYSSIEVFSHSSDTPAITIGANMGTGTLNISANAGVNINGGIQAGIGTGSTGTINATAGGRLLVDRFGSTGGQSILGTDGGTATLNISGSGNFFNRSGATFNYGLLIGQGAGSTGNVNVLGEGKFTTISSANTITDPEFQTVIGIDGGTGNVTVSGDKAGWYVAADTYGGEPADLYVGVNAGQGNIRIANGGVLSVGRATESVIESCMDDYEACANDITSYEGTGTIYMAADANSKASLTIGGVVVNGIAQTPEDTGEIAAAGIVFGAGNGVLNFNHTDNTGTYEFAIPVSGTGTIANYAGTTWLTADNSAFSGSTDLHGGTLGLASNNSIGTSSVHVIGNATLAYAGGLDITNTITIDNGVTLSALTADTDSAQSGAISGAGNLLKTGTANLTLTADNSFTGQTTISEGTLFLEGTGSISQSSVVQVDSIFDISQVASEASAIKSLSGSGEVLLGNKDLQLTAANHTFSGVISGNGGLEVLGGTETLSGANSYLGDTLVSDATLRAGATDTFSAASNYTIETGGHLDLNGFNQTLATLDNAGTVSTNGMANTILTISGDYIGTGGSLVLMTALNSDGSPSDMMVVNGSTSGNTMLFVRNFNGAGALTTGSGIKLIEVHGDSEGIFEQGSRIAAGAYDYTLYQNGIGTDSNDGNWYLRSVYTGSDETAGGDNGASLSIPDIRPEVPLAAAIAPIALEYGYSMLGTLHQRSAVNYAKPPVSLYEDRLVYDQNGRKVVARTQATSDGITDRQQWFNGGWSRVMGNRGSQGKDKQLFSSGPKYDYTFTGVQAGLNLFGRETPSGTDEAGVYFGYGTVSGNVKAAYGGKAGTIDMDAYTLGAYWTHRANTGWYTDAVVQGTWYSTDATSVYGQKLKPDGFGFIASLEGGYSFDLGDGFIIEPQAQIIYQSLSFDKFSDAYGRFKIDDTDSFRGRIGVRIAKSWNMGTEADPRLVSLWGRANIWHEFKNSTKTTVTGMDYLNGVTVPSNLRGTWAEVGIGGSVQVSKQAFIFATTSYSHSLDNRKREAWDARLGVNVKW